MKPSKAQIERAAKAIKFMVQLDPPGWTEKGLREVKWPKGFSAAERKHIRNIARVALTEIMSPADDEGAA
jgi:hypothetical protein